MQVRDVPCQSVVGRASSCPQSKQRVPDGNTMLRLSSRRSNGPSSGQRKFWRTGLQHVCSYQLTVSNVQGRLTKQVSAMSCFRFSLISGRCFGYLRRSDIPSARSSATAWFCRENPSPQFQNPIFTAVHTMLEHTGHPGLGKLVTLKRWNCLLSFRKCLRAKARTLISCRWVLI